MHYSTLLQKKTIVDEIRELKDDVRQLKEDVRELKKELQKRELQKRQVEEVRLKCPVVSSGCDFLLSDEESGQGPGSPADSKAI